MSAPAVAVWGIVLAAGSGTRFGSTKQFARLGPARLVDHSVRSTAAACDEVILVLPNAVEWDGDPVAATVPGGASRVASARRGLADIPPSADVIVIHDAAHPLAPPALFDAVIEAVLDGADAAVPVLPATDTIMRARGGRTTEAVPREGLVIVQTPQAFRASVLRAAHLGSPDASDDGVLVHEWGATVATVPGDPVNVHVTSALELSIAAALFERFGADPQTGAGPRPTPR